MYILINQYNDFIPVIQYNNQIFNAPVDYKKLEQIYNFLVYRLNMFIYILLPYMLFMINLIKLVINITGLENAY